MKMTPDELIRQLSSSVDIIFAQEAVQSYIGMQQRFLAGDWKPAELDGGRLCEAVSRAIFQLDTGIVDHSKLPGAIRDYLIEQKNASHHLGYQDRFHIAKAIEVTYKFRSDRGAVHISPVHSANYMDSMLVLHAGKWILAEFLRLAWGQDRNVIGEVISQLVQLDHSLIHELDGKPLVLSTNVSVPEEILLLLNHASGNRLSRKDIGNYASRRSSGAVSNAITNLVGSREIRRTDDGDLVLTPNGQKRLQKHVIPNLAPK